MTSRNGKAVHAVCVEDENHDYPSQVSRVDSRESLGHDH